MKSFRICTLGKRGEVIVGSGGILEVESDGPGASLEIGPLGSIEASGGNLYIGGNPAPSSLRQIPANNPQTMGITTG